VHHLAAQWIVRLLRDRDIPFLICGGLAAKGYGSERDLNDIDLLSLVSIFRQWFRPAMNLCPRLPLTAKRKAGI
jgi:hypothetical protein